MSRRGYSSRHLSTSIARSWRMRMRKALECVWTSSCTQYSNEQIGRLSRAHCGQPNTFFDPREITARAKIVWSQEPTINGRVS